MSKAGGTYPTIVQGVSEKQPQHRLPGEMTEQVNMLSDPALGLVRRRGTRYVARIAAPGLTPAAKAELARMDVFDFSMDGKDYALLHRRFPSQLGDDLFAFLYCKTDEQFIPINYENSTWVDTLIAGGVSALAAAGSYVYIAGNENIPTAEQVNLWDTEENQNLLAAWFRSGAYSTTYRVSLIREDGTKVTHEYTTKASAYPEPLDTSDIEFFEPGTNDPRPDYQKDVNDRVNEYNGLVNAWIKEAAEDIVPQNIAQKIADQFIVDGYSVTVVEGGLLSNDEEFVDIEVDDGGDNTTVYSVGREITDATRVTKYHFHGKIVRVSPRSAGADEAYYLEARLDDGGTSGPGAVSWFEVAGVSAEITGLFSQMIVHNGEAYIARDGDGLQSIAPDSGEHPNIKPRVVGDGLTSPLPWYIGKPITMLGMFQDRLLVGSRNYVNASRSGDYLNFFRGSVLNITDNDPVEVFAHGSEGDTLRYAVPFNGNMILFGELLQYGIDGDKLFTPRSPLIRPISSNRDSVGARPLASGNYIFYSQHGEDGVSLHQMRVGSLDAEATVTDELSDGIGNWLNGSPLQISALTAPNIVMFRTDGHPSMVYLYQYLDDKNNRQRVQGAWHKFEYNEALGTIVAVSTYRKTALVFSARQGYVVADVASLDGSIDRNHGHMDSRVAYEDRALVDVDDDEAVAVVGRGHEAFLLGTPMSRIAEFADQLPGAEVHLEYGVVSPAWVTPTNPFPRDQNGQAVLDGRMTLNRVSVDVEATGGMMADVSTTSGIVRTTDFEGRILGHSTNLPDEQPIYTGQLNISVGREVRDCAYTIRSKDWLPLRVTGLAWVGQVFNHVQRVS